MTKRRNERADRQREVNWVGLSIEEASISRQIQLAERRAEARCAEYDPSNIFWKKVDMLMERQDAALQKMASNNSSFHHASKITSEIALEAMVVDNNDGHSNEVEDSTQMMDNEEDRSNFVKESVTVNSTKKRVSTSKC